MLYTRKGDSGTTKTFGCDQRVSKSSAIAEALGSLDEINSLLGLCKIRSAKAELIGGVQQTLFIIQAELAGADKTVTEDKVRAVEAVIDDVEKKLPPIKTFFVSGGTEMASLFDFARTVARRAERRVVQVNEEGVRKMGEHSMAYLNRLSSLLYALARLMNHESGITEEPPTYK